MPDMTIERQRLRLEIRELLLRYATEQVQLRNPLSDEPVSERVAASMQSVAHYTELIAELKERPKEEK